MSSSLGQPSTGPSFQAPGRKGRSRRKAPGSLGPHPRTRRKGRPRRGQDVPGDDPVGAARPATEATFDQVCVVLVGDAPDINITRYVARLTPTVRDDTRPVLLDSVAVRVGTGPVASRLPARDLR